MQGLILCGCCRSRNYRFGTSACCQRFRIKYIWCGINSCRSTIRKTGDWIIVDGVEGEVVNIGLRTTLIRTAGTMITVPNSNMVNSPVENFGKEIWRILQNLEEDSNPAKLKQFCEVL